MKRFIAIFVLIIALLLTVGCQKQEETIECPSCGEEVADAKYCSECGKSLSEKKEDKFSEETEAFEEKELPATEGLEYTLLEDGTYSVSVGTATDTNIVIPSSYDGKAVTVIGEKAFEWCESLVSVIIPNSVTTIGNGAFYGCRGMSSITISGDVTSIGDMAFDGCINLTNIKFNGTVQQWDSIVKGVDWKWKVPAANIICTDGEAILR